MSHHEKLKRMDKLYISGDLVMVKKSALQFAKDKIFKVISSLSGGFVKVVMLNDSSTTYSISNNAVRPIPLTSEILENNGWKLCHGFYCSPNEEGAGVCLSSETGYVWNAYLGRQPLRSNINSVSDLQHLLFGLGLNSEMEV